MWEMTEDYAARVAEASGGRLIIESYVQGAIVPATKELEGCSDGIVEMTDTYMGYYPYLLHDVAELFSGRPGGLTETQAYFWLLAEGGVLYQEMVSRINVVRVTQTVMPTAGDVFVTTVPIEGLDDIQGLVSLLIQSMKFGTSIADTLRVYTDEFRDRRMQLAEEKAAKMGTLLIFPLVFCMFPSFFIVAIGPAVLRLMTVFGGN